MDLVAGPRARHPAGEGRRKGSNRADPPGRIRATATRGPAPKRIVTAYGFWIFLLSDFVMFSGFYATYAVLSHSTAGGPGPTDLFNLKTVAFETAFLLLSSFACGLAMIAANARNMLWTQVGFSSPASSASAFSASRSTSSPR